MKLLIILCAVVTITNVSDGSDGPWYEFWKEPARRTNQVLKYFYCRSRNFTEYCGRLSSIWAKSFRRLWFVFWLGACPERVKTTTSEGPELMYVTGYPHGRARKYPLIYHPDEMPFVPPTKPPGPAPATACPPSFRRPT
ncbi:uncharacterized protein LOC134667666 [Cydia fagiglandana]|uniref:uncharacterized protein LOC134667666 n=1 Tax=Cydia fagiglandana TaxID=1458189 RepID=UPI002FEE0065